MIVEVALEATTTASTRQAYRCLGTRGPGVRYVCGRRIADVEDGWLIVACERCRAEHRFRLAPAEAVDGVTVVVWRCSGCRRIVAKHAGFVGALQIKCKCGTVNYLQR